MNDHTTGNMFDEINESIQKFIDFRRLISTSKPIAFYGNFNQCPLLFELFQKNKSIYHIVDIKPKLSKSSLRMMVPEEAFVKFSSNLILVFSRGISLKKWLNLKNKFEKNYLWDTYVAAQILISADSERISSKDENESNLPGQSARYLHRNEWCNFYDSLLDDSSKELAYSLLEMVFWGKYPPGKDLILDPLLLEMATSKKVNYVYAGDSSCIGLEKIKVLLDSRFNLESISLLETSLPNLESLRSKIYSMQTVLDGKTRVNTYNLLDVDGKYLFDENIASQLPWDLNGIVIIDIDLPNNSWLAIASIIDFIIERTPIIRVDIGFRLDDLIDISLLVRSLNLDYHFSLRSYCAQQPNFSLVLHVPKKNNLLHEDSRSYDKNLDGKSLNLAELNFESFQKLASNPKLSRHVKVGFPDSYRSDKEEAIFRDVIGKIPSLTSLGGTVLEIGPGCSLLPVKLADLCRDFQKKLIFSDSKEMLDLLPNAYFIEKISGKFNSDSSMFTPYFGRIRSIICYSVLQYVFEEDDLWNFLSGAMSLLENGGELLLGDIPNANMRKRYFSSPDGIRAHETYAGKDKLTISQLNDLNEKYLGDEVVLKIVEHAREKGFHAWIIPQAPALPMSNRREDILIRRP